MKNRRSTEFQSLIGTVQRQCFKENRKHKRFIVSISHRYGSTFVKNNLEEMVSKNSFQSLIGTVQHVDWLENDGVFIGFQSLIGTVQQKTMQYCVRSNVNVSISHRYGSTTVFTAFSVFIIPHFPCFSTFFFKKVGQPLHSKFPQSLDSTGFFIFVKIDSEVHRLFDRFFAVSGTFPCCFCSGSLDFTGLEVHRLFLQIF